MFALKPNTRLGGVFGGPEVGDIHIDFRHPTREDALIVVRSLMHQLVFVQRALKQQLRTSHHLSEQNTRQIQREMERTKARLRLLNTMLASSRGKLVHEYKRRYEHYQAVLMRGDKLPHTLAEYKRQALGDQASWVTCHVVQDYQYARMRLGGANRAYEAVAWWYETQLSVAHTIYPPDFEYARHGKEPMLLVEAWEGLVGLPDTAARESAYRLGARQVNQSGWPELNPWR